MPQFLIKNPPRADRATVEDEEAHHARNVFRMKEGDAIRLFDGNGTGWDGKIARVGKTKLEVQILRERKAAAPKVRVTLAQSVLPRDAMDWAVHKAVELGAAQIVPVLAERCVSRSDKKSHWEKIVLAACKQCDRLDLPLVHDAVPLKKLGEIFSNNDLVLLASLEKGAVPIQEVLNRAQPKSVLALVGPEGDFSAAEFEFLRDKVTGASFGAQVLKSETAALFVLSALKFRYAL